MVPTEKNILGLSVQGSWHRLHVETELSTGATRALALLELERFQEADKAYESVPRLDSLGLIGRAASKLEQGKKAEAKLLFRSVGACFEPDVELLVTLGFAQCVDASTDIDASIQRLEKLTRFGGNAHYRFACFAFGGLPWSRLTHDDLEQMLGSDVSNLYWSAFLYQPLDHTYLEWIKANVLVVRPGYGIRFCLLCLALNRLDEASTRLSQNRSEWEILPTYQQALGHLATREGRLTEARDYYQAGLDNSPGWISIMADLAYAEYKIGRYEHAANLLIQISKFVDPSIAYEFLIQIVGDLVRLGFLALDGQNRLIQTS